MLGGAVTSADEVEVDGGGGALSMLSPGDDIPKECAAGRERWTRRSEG